MPGFQSVVNHLRFARHWLAKAEGEFERAQSVEGELTLSLVEAEVRKAWAESQRTLVGQPSSRALPAARRGQGRAFAAGVVVLALATLAATWGLTHPRPPAETRLNTTGLSGGMAKVLPSAEPLPATPAAAPPEAAPKTANLPVGPKAQVDGPGEVQIVPRAVTTAVFSADDAAPVDVPATVPATAAVVSAAPVEPPATLVAFAPPTTARPAAEVVEHKVEPPKVVEKPVPESQPAETRPPAVVTAVEGGGTPLPLDVVELVRIAERSLTGRP